MLAKGNSHTVIHTPHLSPINISLKEDPSTDESCWTLVAVAQSKVPLVKITSARMNGCIRECPSDF